MSRSARGAGLVVLAAVILAVPSICCRAADAGAPEPVAAAAPASAPPSVAILAMLPSQLAPGGKVEGLLAAADKVGAS